LTNTTGRISDNDARRIARRVNAWITAGSGGKCVFDRDGHGGQWYAAADHNYPPGSVVITIPGSYEHMIRPEHVTLLFDRR
jgi:hypothetical protein